MLVKGNLADQSKEDYCVLDQTAYAVLRRTHHVVNDVSITPQRQTMHPIH